VQLATLTIMKGELRLVQWGSLKTAAVVGVSALLAVDVATVAAEQTLTNDVNGAATNTTWLSEVRLQWEKQSAAMQAGYFEFTETTRGALTNWDYGVANTYRAYFDGNRFYRQEKAPGYESYDNEVAFDGQTVWQRNRDAVRRCSLADAPGALPSRLVRWPYLDAAGIYAPQYISELEGFSSMQPLALHYLEQGKPTKVEAAGEKVRVTFRVADELANIQSRDPKKHLGDRPDATASKRGAETAAKPARTVVMLLDAKHGYGIAEREEWNAGGQRIGHLRSEEWKFYESAGIWLPSRCVATYYARPRVFVAEYSEQSIHFVTNELKYVEFGKKDISFGFEQKKPDRRIFDRTSAAASLTDSLRDAVAEKVDAAAVERIQTEVAQHSQVMDLVSWLTDVYGPRLTGSPGTQAASEWAVEKMRSWGLSNVHLEPWGPYERGWRGERFGFQAIAPQPFVINAVPAVWSPSTPGKISGPGIRFDVHSLADMQRYAGKLKGAFLLFDPPQPTPAHFKPEATRLSEARLAALGAEEPLRSAAEQVEEVRYTDRLINDATARRWLIREGAAVALFAAPGDGGTIFLAGNGGSGWLNKSEPDQMPIVKVGAESYGRIARILEKNIPVTLELEMQNRFYDNPKVFNIIAEIPGTDPRLKDEVVMMGAHFDSWTFGTGATDNAAGSAMLMEAMRILKALNLQPRRTIRIALWTGEEQGTLGSKAYVRQHYRDGTGDAATTKAEYDTFSVYFNVDGGTGKIRGIFELGNAAPGLIFDDWMGPFKDMGMKTVSVWNIGGGDDLSFKRVGLPSFGFIQDPIEYDSRTHHSSADVYERIQSADLQFNTAVLVTFAWQAAQRDEAFPR
jgi:carboxypeptidase Q